MFNVEGNTKSWDQLIIEFSVNDSSFFEKLQLTNAITSDWEKNIKRVLILLITSFEPSLIIGNPLLKLEKLNSEELYNIQKYFESSFSN